MRNMFKKIAIILPVLMILTGCGDNSSKPETTEPALQISVDNSSIAVGETATVTLHLANITEEVFGMSFQVSYNNTVLDFADSSDVTAGDYFGTNILLFAHAAESAVHVTITRLQGQDGVSGDGDICNISFGADAAGTSTIGITDGSLNFYDADGNLIDITSLEIDSVDIQVN